MGECYCVWDFNIIEDIRCYCFFFLFLWVCVVGFFVVSFLFCFLRIVQGASFFVFLRFELLFLLST